MAIIAPHIEAAQDALLTATAQAQDLKTKLAEHNPENLPTLFVEGATDYRLFNTLFLRFRPNLTDAIFIAEPPNRAGANYVTNMLRSWEYRTKQLPTNQRTKAVGVVDFDPEGIGALDRFVRDNNNWNHVTAIPLHTPAHLLPAYGLGLHIPIAIEELWPMEIWQEADGQGWLEERQKNGLQTAEFVEILTERDAKPSDVIEDIWRIYYDKRADSTLKSHAKTNWVNFMIALPDERLEALAEEHLAVLDEAVGTLNL